MVCGTTTVKISTIAFNILLAILGIGTLAWVAFNPDSMSNELAIAYYVTGSLIIVFAFLGCFAALRESVCLAATCAIFLLILAILQTVATIIDLNDHETRNGLLVVSKAWDRNEMDALQIEHECCGKDSAQNYVLLNKPIPASCYADKNINDASQIFQAGCSAKVRDFYDNEETRLLIVSCVLIAFELLGFLLAVFLVINFRNKQRRMEF